jgi:VIT1/CCC1 family predicted Fe2+/Mn2+ transporter
MATETVELDSAVVATEHDELAKMSIQDVQEKAMSKPVPYTPHNGENRQYMRDIILGVNDGLVSMFLLVFGMAGGGSDAYHILMAAITGAVAGAISMALGEYIATKSQSEVMESDLALEKEHFLHHREVELEELRVSLAALGLRGKLLEDCTQEIGKNDDTLLKFMMSFEFGHTELDERNPVVAMLMSGCLFLTGSVPSVLPYLCTHKVFEATLAAGVLCCCTLFAVGALKCVNTKGNWLWGGTENLLLGVAGAAVAYGVGAIYYAVG